MSTSSIILRNRSRQKLSVSNSRHQQRKKEMWQQQQQQQQQHKQLQNQYHHQQQQQQQQQYSHHESLEQQKHQNFLQHQQEERLRKEQKIKELQEQKYQYQEEDDEDLLKVFEKISKKISNMENMIQQMTSDHTTAISSSDTPTSLSSSSSTSSSSSPMLEMAPSSSSPLSPTSRTKNPPPSPPTLVSVESTSQENKTKSHVTPPPPPSSSLSPPLSSSSSPPPPPPPANPLESPSPPPPSPPSSNPAKSYLPSPIKAPNSSSPQKPLDVSFASEDSLPLPNPWKSPSPPALVTSPSALSNKDDDSIDLEQSMNSSASERQEEVSTQSSLTVSIRNDSSYGRDTPLLEPPPPMAQPSGGDRRQALTRQSSKVIRREVKFNVDTGFTSTRECVAEEVTGLTEPMDPSKRRRKEFMSSKSSNGLDSSLHNSRGFLVRSNSAKSLNISGHGGRKFKIKSEKSVEKPLHPQEDNKNDNSGNGNNNNNNNNNNSINVPASLKQYRLRSKSKNSHYSRIGIDEPLGDPSSRSAVTYVFSRFIQWTFQTTFFNVLVVLSLLFFFFTTCWAGLIYMVGVLQPECIYIGPFNFETGGHHFIDAYAISWTTFSTVGYGLLGPAVSGEDRCIGINILTAVEAFFGVLYAGFAGAVIFGKVAKIQSIARVIWSDPIVVRYGSGVKEDALVGQLRLDDDEEFAKSKLALPVLEFRVVNQLNSSIGGEIVNANITVWASTLAEFASPSIRKAANLKPTKDKKNKDDKKRRKKALKSLTQKSVRGLAKTPTTATKVLLKTPTAVGKGLKATSSAAVKGVKATSSAAVKGVKATADVAAKGVKVTADVAAKGLSAGAALRSAVVVGGLASRVRTKLAKRRSEGEQSEWSSALNKSSLFEASMSTMELEKEQEQEKEKKRQKELQAELEKQAMLHEVSLLQAGRKHISMQEDPDGGVKIYSKLDVETDSHPFFKRVWVIRHVLNETSPLLSERAKILIQRNGGYWPHELNNYQSVRKHLQFKELMVIFSGTANVSGSTVYSQKVYDYVDVNIGYRFANTLVGSTTSTLTVDTSLINDVMEQHGGGAEPFTDVLDEVGKIDNESHQYNKEIHRISVHADSSGNLFGANMSFLPAIDDEKED